MDKQKVMRVSAYALAIASLMVLVWTTRGYLHPVTYTVPPVTSVIEGQVGSELPDRLTAQGAAATPAPAQSPAPAPIATRAPVPSRTAAPRQVSHPNVPAEATPVLPAPISAAYADATPAPEASHTPTADAHPLSALVEIGTNFGSARVNPHIDNSCCRAGVLIGAHVEYGLSDSFSVMPGLRYVQKGGRATIGGSQVEVALDYLELPLQVKYRFAGQSVRPYVFGGPSLGINTSAQGTSYGVTSDLKPSTNTVDVSVDAGVGAELPVNAQWSAFLGAAYSFGLLDADRSADSWRSRSFQFSGGMKYTLP